MPSRNRLLIAAIGGWLATGVAYGQPIGNGPSSDKPTANGQGNPSGGQEEAPYRPPFERIARALEAMYAASNADDEKGRQNRDLKAQEDMAWWAMLMFLTTFGQTIIGGVGLWAILRTLKYSRDTAKASVDSAKASRDSADAAIKSAETAELATIALESPRLFLNFKNETVIDAIKEADLYDQSPEHITEISATFTVGNYGRSAAFMVAFNAVLDIHSGNHAIDAEAVWSDQDDDRVIKENDEGKPIEKLRVDITLGDVAKVVEGENHIFLYGNGRYIDVFNRDWYFVFCWEYDVRRVAFRPHGDSKLNRAENLRCGSYIRSRIGTNWQG